VEDVKERQNRLAKMRSLLFRHEIKAKRMKKIKSRTYHRMLKKDKLKAASADMLLDTEAAKDYAEKQERMRAEVSFYSFFPQCFQIISMYVSPIALLTQHSQERMTLKHKNTSRWARRIKKRGLSVQDEGTQAAIAAQLQQHALLTRKMNSMNDGSSSSDESSDDDEEESESEAKLLNRGKEKILQVLEEDNEIPKSGVFSLPFMVSFVPLFILLLA
jgi:U3 small nucleolar RNA-associated protein 14